MTTSERLGRDLWNLVVGHAPSRRLRRFWLSRILGGLGDGAFVAMHVTLLAPRGIFLGPRALINPHCILDGRGELQIAEDVDIAPHVHIWTLEHDINDPDHGTVPASVRIEDHAWIAARSTILPGVTIGRGAVVAAGAVVARDVPPLAVVAGVPAKVIGRRDNPLRYRNAYAPRFR